MRGDLISEKIYRERKRWLRDFLGGNHCLIGVSWGSRDANITRRGGVGEARGSDMRTDLECNNFL